MGHCFCIKDDSGNLTCCKCGTTLMSCEACPVRYCVYREQVKMATGKDDMFMPDCLIASSHYALLYKETPV